MTPPVTMPTVAVRPGPTGGDARSDSAAPFASALDGALHGDRGPAREDGGRGLHRGDPARPADPGRSGEAAGPHPRGVGQDHAPHGTERRSEPGKNGSGDGRHEDSRHGERGPRSSTPGPGTSVAGGHPAHGRAGDPAGPDDATDPTAGTATGPDAVPPGLAALWALAQGSTAPLTPVPAGSAAPAGGSGVDAVGATAGVTGAAVVATAAVAAVTGAPAAAGVVAGATLAAGQPSTAPAGAPGTPGAAASAPVASTQPAGSTAAAAAGTSALPVVVTGATADPSVSPAKGAPLPVPATGPQPEPAAGAQPEPAANPLTQAVGAAPKAPAAVAAATAAAPPQQAPDSGGASAVPTATHVAAAPGAGAAGGDTGSGRDPSDGGTDGSAGPPAVLPQMAPTPVAAPASVATPPASPAPPAVAAQLAQPVLALRSGPDGTHSMTVVLSPDNLGPVQVQVTLDQGTIGLTLRGAHEHGRDALLSALPDLRRDLQSAGLNCSNLDVDRGTGGSWSTPQQGGGGERGQTWRNDPAPRSWGRPAGPAEPRTAVPTAGSVTAGLDVRV